MRKRDRSRQYLKDGYVNAAVIILIVTSSWPIGRLLDGIPFTLGRFTAIYYSVVLTGCLALLIVGVRRVRGQSSER
jgi:hypothetical protein